MTPSMPCQARECRSQMRPLMDSMCSADGWTMTANPRQQRRDWHCEKWGSAHSLTEVRSRPQTKEEARE